MVTCEWGNVTDDDLGPLGIDYRYIYYCSPPQLSYFILILFFLWIFFLINLLAQTASNYFSPTLSRICDKLNIAYDIAGVTFLAFGNGAPDFFSLLASFSGGVDVLVGVGALLGGSMFVCTIVVGSIAIICPCEVEKQFFLRDISFHLVAVLSIATVAMIRHISVPVACGLLLLYLSYVTLVIISSFYNQTSNSDVTSAAGDIVLTDFSSAPTNNFIQTAFWHHDPNKKPKKKEFKKFEPPAPSNGGYSFLILKEPEDEDPEHGKESDRQVDEDGTINISGGFEPSFEMIIQEDFYSPSNDSTSHFTIEDDQEEPASTLEQSLLRPEETPPHEQDAIMSKFRLENRLKPQNIRKYNKILSALYWQQWALRRPFQHSALSREWHNYSLLSKFLVYLEYPLTFARDLTIPILEDSEWNKMYAVIHPVSSPLFVVFILGHSYDLIGAGFPLVLLVLLAGLVPSTGIYLLTTHSRPPEHPIFKVVWTLTAFFMCVMWVFTFAGELITCLTSLGEILKIQPAFLGLTILAWGNSIGDWFTNTAVAREGLGSMAIAGCYAGPVFNILMGLGVALVYATVQSYPATYPVVLDTSSIISICFLVVALSSTIAIVSYRNFKLDRLFGYYLITLYATYTVLQLTVVILFS